MMKDYVKQILKPLGCPVEWLTRPKLTGKTPTVISFHFFNMGVNFYGNGTDLDTATSLQVDVFSTVDFKETVGKIKEEMKKHKIRYVSSFETLETIDNTQLYHKILIFNMYESEMKANGKIL